MLKETNTPTRPRIEPGSPDPESDALTIRPVRPRSPIGRTKILTYPIWGFLGAAILDCIIRSCDLFYWFIRTCLGPTVVPAVITSLELFCVLTMCYFSDNVSCKENIKILLLIFMFYYGEIIAIKNSYWFFSFTWINYDFRLVIFLCSNFVC